MPIKIRGQNGVYEMPWDKPGEPSSQDIDAFLAKVEPPSNVAPKTEPQKPSLWERANTPLTTAPSRLANRISTAETTPRLSDKTGVMNAITDPMHSAEVKGFAGGAMEGAGNLVSSLTSPFNLGLTALSLGSGTAGRIAAKSGAESLAELTTAMRAARTTDEAAKIAPALNKIRSVRDAAQATSGTLGAIERGGMGAIAGEAGYKGIRNRDLSQAGPFAMGVLGMRSHGPVVNPLMGFEDVGELTAADKRLDEIRGRDFSRQFAQRPTFPTESITTLKNGVMTPQNVTTTPKASFEVNRPSYPSGTSSAVPPNIGAISPVVGAESTPSFGKGTATPATNTGTFRAVKPTTTGPMNKVDMANAEMVKTALTLPSKPQIEIDPTKPAEVKLKNVNEDTVRDLINNGYQPGKANLDGSVTFHRENPEIRPVQNITRKPQIEGELSAPPNLKAPEFGKVQRINQPNEGLTKVNEPDAYTVAKANLDARHARGEVVDYEDELDNLTKQHGVINTISEEDKTLNTAIKKAHDRGDIVWNEKAPGLQKDLQNGYEIIEKLPGGYVSVNRKIGNVKDIQGRDLGTTDQKLPTETTRPNEKVNTETGEITPEEMRVPGTSNIALGGADPRVLDILGNSLYSGDRPTIVSKELLQNAFDEHRIAKSKEPIKVLFNEGIENPVTKQPNRAITIKDKGRGLNPDQLYTVFSDVGKTGKGDEESASGGFGFAKAAPFLSGTHLKVISVFDEGGVRKKATFEGTPDQLKKQKTGVPLNVQETNEPTGLTVTTYFPQDTYLGTAEDYVKGMTERSPSVTSNVHFLRDYSYPGKKGEKFLTDEPYATGSGYGEVNEYKAKPYETKQATIRTPGAKINLHYERPPRGTQQQGYNLQVLNKGLFQKEHYNNYSMNAVPNVPKNITADIHATVEEGQPGYPFTANREQLDSSVNDAIKEWVKDNLVKGAEKNRIDALQKDYDSVKPIVGDTHFLDDGKKFLPGELKELRKSVLFQNATQKLNDVHQEILKIADGLGWSMHGYEGVGLPSERLKKFGLLFKQPDAGGVTLGIHIPNPGSMNESAILINLMEHLKRAIAENIKDPADKLATGLLATITHEQAHIPGGGHSTDFAYRHAQLMEALGSMNTVRMLTKLHGIFGDLTNERISPEVHKIISIYDQSRERPASGTDDLIGTGVASERPTSSSGIEKINEGSTNTGETGIRPVSHVLGQFKSERGSVTLESSPKSIVPKGTKPVQPSFKNPFDLLSATRSFMAGPDLSMPLRQGSFMVTRPQFWKSLEPMMRGAGSEKYFQSAMKGMEQDRNFSKARDAGLKLTGLDDMNNREESIISSLPERISLLGKAYRGSNRAATLFINKLRFDTFKSTIEGIKDPETIKALANYINNATGRGDLKAKFGGYKIAGKELPSKNYDFEGAATALNTLFFSPRFAASRMRLLSPGYYIKMNPVARKEALRDLVGSVLVLNSVLGLGKLAGAKVGTDPTSSDFGKMLIGNTRIDFTGGFGPYIRLAAQLARNQKTSSITGKTTKFNTGKFGAPTKMDAITQFLQSKEAPVTSFLTDYLKGKEQSGDPFELKKAVTERFTPMILQDMYDIIKEDPKKLGLAIPGVFGAGVQTYGKRNVKRSSTSLPRLPKMPSIH